MDSLSLSLALLAVIVGLFYYYSTSNFNYWKDRGVEFIKPYPIFGSLFSLLTLQEHFDDCFTRMKKKFNGRKFVGYFQGPTPALLVLDPELIKNIFIKDFAHFVDHAFEVSDDVDPLQSKNLFNMVGHRWKEMRTKLSPTFTSGKIKGMYPLIEDISKNMEGYIKEHLNENLDIKELLARFTTDVIGSCAFGVNTNSIKKPDDQFRVMGKRMLEINFVQGLKNGVIFFLPKIAKFLNFKMFEDDVGDFFRAVIKDIVGKREKTGNNRKDFMQLLIQLKERGRLIPEEGEVADNEDFAHSDENKITEDDLVAQSINFFFAGFEASSSTLTFALMEMARFPHQQQKARENIEEVLQRHNGVMSYEALKEMTYLDWIMQEALRMYPPASFLTRMCTKNYKIPDTNISIDKGTLINCPIRALQLDPEYFDNPDTFEPSRFADEELIRKTQFVYMPFGEGPRQCIAIRFAKMQSKLGLYSILRNFEILESPKTIYPPVWDPTRFVLSAKDDIFVQFKAVA